MPSMLIDFRTGLPDDWFIVNDGVMGGRSSSALNRGDEAAVFEGEISLENNGGFASFRVCVPEGALAGASRLRVRLRGDGRRYQLRLRHGHDRGGVAYKAAFDAPEQDTTVAIPLMDFEATYRGSRPPGAGPVDPARVGQVGILLADGEPGPFRLEIQWIHTEQDDGSGEEVGP